MNDPDPVPPGFDLSEWQSRPTPATAGSDDWCPPHDWLLRCPTCGAEERVSEAGAVDALCWVFTALRHGGDESDPRTWTMHLPTARNAVALLAGRGFRLLLPEGCDCG